MGRLLGFGTDVGNKRTLNEDYIGYFEDSTIGIFIIADGMGGHNAGEIASKLAVDTIIDYIKDNKESNDIREVLDESIAEANRKIYKHSIVNEDCKGMGTTVTIAVVKDKHAVIGNVGDSRGYLFSNGILKRITKDHSLVQELLDNGTITNEEAFNHPNKNVITRAVGTNYTVKADYYDIDLEDIDRIILCSDGLTNEVTELELKNVLIENKKDSCKALIELSNLKGGRDNISIIIFKGECADDRNYIG